MATLIRNRRIESPPSPEGRQILRIEPHQDPAEIADQLSGVECVEIRFPKFGDGRGFSLARLLRERYGYRGELRAVGHVVRDHLRAMEACGFDAFLLKEGEDAQEALQALDAFPLFGRLWTGTDPIFLK